MPRTYTRTSEKQMDRTNLEKAFYHRVNTGCSIQKAAVEFGVKKTTLMVVLSVKDFYPIPNLYFRLI